MFMQKGMQKFILREVNKKYFAQKVNKVIVLENNEKTKTKIYASLSNFSYEMQFN